MDGCLSKESFFPRLFCSDLLIEVRVLSENRLQWTGSATSTLQRKQKSFHHWVTFNCRPVFSFQVKFFKDVFVCVCRPRVSTYSSTPSSWHLVFLPPASALLMNSHQSALRCTFIPYLAKTFKSNNTWLVSFLKHFSSDVFVAIFFNCRKIGIT